MPDLWEIVAGASPDDDALRIDSSNWVWDIERGDDHRRVVVEVTNQSRLPGAGTDETARAFASQGRSVVESILALENPPRRITCSTRGLHAPSSMPWHIAGGPRTINLDGPGSADVSAGWIWQIRRGDDARSVSVYVSQTAEIANDTVDETRRALQTHGRSVVQELLQHDVPPERVTCSTHGWGWDGLVGL